MEVKESDVWTSQGSQEVGRNQKGRLKNSGRATGTKCEKAIIGQMFNYKEHMDENSSNNFSTFDEPYLELFLWAVLTNKWILVDYFWPRLQTPLLGALIAGSICSKLAHVNKADKSSDYKGLSTRKIKFQTIASEIIEKAFLNDQSKAFSLLDLRNPRWGDKNLLNISHIGYLRAFVASKFSSQCSLNLYTYNLHVYCVS